MARGLSYADAVRVLGGKQNRVVTALDDLTGGVLLGAAAAGGGLALSLFDPAAKLARLSAELLTATRERFDGVRRYDRTQRLEAAHAITVLAAFFAELAAAKLPFDPARLELTRTDQVRLGIGGSAEGTRLGELAGILLLREVPCPAPQRPYEENLLAVEGFYMVLAASVRSFVEGLSVWDALDETERERAVGTLAGLQRPAVRRYEAMFRQLAADFPEVAFWAGSVDHQATRESLAGLGRVLDALAVGRAPDQRRAAISRSYRAYLDRPILSEGDARIPTLGELYVDPRFRLGRDGSAGQLASERWWQATPVRDDLQSFLTGYFTSPGAVETPLLVLGHPGSGKSALSKVLAARLPPSDFLTVVVPLREVPADADVQTQIEYAVRATTGETVTWPDLVRGAGEAMPVVILDGFDELVQATGTTQSDYLERLAGFQRREAELDRPVVVMVTSRTAVADRARSVNGMTAVRLEPFDEQQIRRWLAIWNAANPDRPAEVALEHFALASQPLLLVMMALFGAEGGSLQNGSGTLAQYDLFENLLTAFAAREVRKTGAALPDTEFRLAVEHELIRLSVVAFAMFNRNRQRTSEAELDRDLSALLGSGKQPSTAGLRAPLTAAQIAIGRFYFVHQAQAVRDGVTLRTYEFLHATFGEFLVARLVVRELLALAETMRLTASRGRDVPPDDDFLFALLSQTALANRNTVIGFLQEGLAALSEDQLVPLKQQLLGLFRRALHPRRSASFADYQPGAVTLTCQHAAWSANLVLLAVLVDGSVTGDELFPDSREKANAWRSTALLWRSQLNSEGWNGMVHALDVIRTLGDGRRTIRVEPLTGDAQLPPIDLGWSYTGAGNRTRRNRAEQENTVAKWRYYDFEDLRRHSAFLCDRVDDTVMHLAEPFRYADAAIGTVHVLPGGVTLTPASALVALTLADEGDELVTAYERCLIILEHGFLDGTTDDESAKAALRGAVSRLLMADRHRLPPVLFSQAFEIIAKR